MILVSMVIVMTELTATHARARLVTPELTVTKVYYIDMYTCACYPGYTTNIVFFHASCHIVV